jgi:hypothetical protein
MMFINSSAGRALNRYPLMLILVQNIEKARAPLILVTEAEGFSKSYSNSDICVEKSDPLLYSFT